MNKTTVRKVATRPVVNTYPEDVHVGDGRRIAPGAVIPADVGEDVRKALLATGFFI